MKNLLMLIGGLAMLSCTKKNWNCKCTVNGDEYGKTIVATNSSKANTECSNFGKEVGQSFGSYSYVCKVTK